MVQIFSKFHLKIYFSFNYFFLKNRPIIINNNKFKPEIKIIK